MQITHYLIKSTEYCFPLYAFPTDNSIPETSQIEEVTKFLRDNGFTGFAVTPVYEGQSVPCPTDDEAKALGEIVEKLLRKGQIQHINLS